MKIIDDAPLRPFQLRVIALCALITMLEGFDIPAAAYAAPSLVREWSVPAPMLGAIFSAGLLGICVGALALSPLADRIGRRPVVIASVTAFGLFMLLTMATSSPAELLACRFLTGLGLGGALPNVVALTGEYSPRRLRATLVSIMFIGLPVGTVLGGIVSGPLIENFGWRAIFLVGGLLPLLTVPLLIAWLPESLRFLINRGLDEARVREIASRFTGNALEGAPLSAAEIEEEGKVARGSVRELFRGGRAGLTILLWTACFMNLLIVYVLASWLPTLLAASGLTLRQSLMTPALFYAGGIFGAYPLGRLIDRKRPAIVMGVNFALASLFITGVAMSVGDFPPLAAFALLSGVGTIAAQIGLNAFAATAYPTAIRSTGVGWALGIGRLGSILGPFLVGFLVQSGWGAREVVLAAIVPVLIASASCFGLRWFDRDIGRQANPA